MNQSIRTIKEFRNNLLMVYYAEGQELNSDERRLIENILLSVDRLLKR